MQLLTVNYLPDGDDWTVTVTGDAGRRSTRATGLIAARDQADQLVAQIAPRNDGRTVVHLLDGDAFAFTNTYLHVRLGLTRDTPVASPPAVASPVVASDEDRPVEAAAPAETDATAEPAQQAAEDR
jgi:hypothetical protein